MMRRKIVALALGIPFGFALTRVGASEYDMIYRMFVGSDLTVAWVILTAIVVGYLGMLTLKAMGGLTASGVQVAVSRKPLHKLSLLGAALFGSGWGLSGACPGTVLAQVGSGRVMGIFTMIGMVLGTYGYAWLLERSQDQKR